jgi:hypothetical protein
MEGSISNITKLSLLPILIALEKNIKIKINDDLDREAAFLKIRHPSIIVPGYGQCTLNAHIVPAKMDTEFELYGPDEIRKTVSDTIKKLNKIILLTWNDWKNNSPMSETLDRLGYSGLIQRGQKSYWNDTDEYCISIYFEYETEQGQTFNLI